MQSSIRLLKTGNDARSVWRHNTYMNALTTFCRKHTTIVLIFILCIHILVRLPFVPINVKPINTRINIGWMRSAAILGVAESYSRQLGGVMIPNHGPVEIALFGALGHIYRTFVSSEFSASLPVTISYLKIPALLGDIGICLLLFAFFVLLGKKLQGLIAVAVYSLHPVALAIGPLWGQSDGLVTLFLFAALVAVAFRQWQIAGAMPVFAYMTKPTAVVLVPLLFFVFILEKQRWKMVLGAVAALAFFSFFFLINGNSEALLRYIFHAPHTTTMRSGFNATVLLSLLGIRPEFPFGISLREGTFVLFCVLSSLFLFFYRKLLREPLHFLIAASFTAHLFFVIVWAVHPQHNFPFIVIGIPLLFYSWQGIALYTCISLTTLANVEYHQFFGKQPLPSNVAIPLEAMIAAANTLTCLWFLTFVLRSVRNRATNPAPHHPRCSPTTTS